MNENPSSDVNKKSIHSQKNIDIRFCMLCSKYFSDFQKQNC